MEGKIVKIDKKFLKLLKEIFSVNRQIMLEIDGKTYDLKVDGISLKENNGELKIENLSLGSEHEISIEKNGEFLIKKRSS